MASASVRATYALAPVRSDEGIWGRPRVVWLNSLSSRFSRAVSLGVPLGVSLPQIAHGVNGRTRCARTDAHGVGHWWYGSTVSQPRISRFSTVPRPFLTSRFRRRFFRRFSASNRPDRLTSAGMRPRLACELCTLSHWCARTEAYGIGHMAQPFLSNTSAVS